MEFAQGVAVGRIAAGIVRGRGVDLDEAAELHRVVADAEAVAGRGRLLDRGRGGRTGLQPDDVLLLRRLLGAGGDDFGLEAVQLGFELGDTGFERGLGVLGEGGAGRENHGRSHAPAQKTGLDHHGSSRAHLMRASCVNLSFWAVGGH